MLATTPSPLTARSRKTRERSSADSLVDETRERVTQFKNYRAGPSRPGGRLQFSVSRPRHPLFFIFIPAVAVIYSDLHLSFFLPKLHASLQALVMRRKRSILAFGSVRKSSMRIAKKGLGCQWFSSIWVPYLKM